MSTSKMSEMLKTIWNTARTLARSLLREKKVSAEVVVRTFIKRCDEVNELLNAIVETRYKEAIAEAKNVDKLLASKSHTKILKNLKPFLGVPFITRESNEAKGMFHTMGMLARVEHRSREDATAIAYVKNAGAILIAKTNVPELDSWVESRNLLYGQTNNPYNTTRTVGGSSGGDAAIIASCGVPFAIGSDIEGSIRMSAFFNGVFGLKPSERATPLKGIGFRTHDFADSMAEVGPICKRAEDLLPLLKVMLADKDLKKTLDTPVDVETLQIFYQESSGDIWTSKINGDMRAALTRAVAHLRTLTDFRFYIKSRESQTSGIEEWMKIVNRKPEMTIASNLQHIDAECFPKDESKWSEPVINEMRKYLTRTLGNNGVLIYPSSPFPACHHFSYFLRPFNFAYWALFNVLRFPACQVPLGLNSEGLPVGIQVIAAPRRDHLCIAVAKELETVFGGWVPPSS